MKYIPFLLMILVVQSCTRGGVSTTPTADSGCINKLVTPVTAQGSLSTSDFGLVKNIFIANGINFQNFRFSRTYKDSTTVFNGRFEYRNVYIIQYVNGLPIFGESLNYLFKNQVFSNLAGNLTNGTTLNTTPTLKLPQLRKLFIADMQQFDNIGDKYKDSCVNAEFGYIDLNSGIPNTTEKLVKAWHLTPNYYEYPQAVYEDVTGKRVYYNNGIVTVH